MPEPVKRQLVLPFALHARLVALTPVRGMQAAIVEAIEQWIKEREAKK